jgi:hypothetical protein
MRLSPVVAAHNVSRTRRRGGGGRADGAEAGGVGRRVGPAQLPHVVPDERVREPAGERGPLSHVPRPHAEGSESVGSRSEISIPTACIWRRRGLIK